MGSVVAFVKGAYKAVAAAVVVAAAPFIEELLALLNESASGIITAAIGALVIYLVPNKPA